MTQSNLANSSSELFEALAREATLSARVTNRIKQYIVSGQLQPGDRLPPERELARQFSVSRTVVREAVRALTAQGLLEVRAGSGSVVRNPGSEAFAESMALYLRVGGRDFDYRKILEVRRVLEVEIAGLVAERCTPEDLAALTALVAEIPSVADDGDGWLRNDMDFHALLAQATKKELFSLLLDSIADVLASVRHMGFSVPNAATRTLKYHGAILEQVRQRDPEGARQAMRDHLDEAEATMYQALVRQAAHSVP